MMLRVCYDERLMTKLDSWSTVISDSNVASVNLGASYINQKHLFSFQVLLYFQTQRARFESVSHLTESSLLEQSCDVVVRSITFGLQALRNLKKDS